MSLGDSLISLTSAATRLAARTVDTVPVPGVVRSAVRGVARALTGGAHHESQEARADAWAPPETDLVPRPEPSPLRAAVAHEPTASSRADAHGGSPGRHADDWTEELVEDDEPAPVTEDVDGPLITPGAARALRKEAEVMQRGARPHT